MKRSHTVFSDLTFRVAGFGFQHLPLLPLPVADYKWHISPAVGVLLGLLLLVSRSVTKVQRCFRGEYGK
jgi:hypothetical protein